MAQSCSKLVISVAPTKPGPTVLGLPALPPSGARLKHCIKEMALYQD